MTDSMSSTPNLNPTDKPLSSDSVLFLQFCDYLKELHVRKAHDYGNGKDPLGNFEQARDWGLTPLQGCMIRIGDKIARLQSFMKKGVLLNEGVDDTLTDLAAYALLAKVLLRRESGPEQDRTRS